MSFAAPFPILEAQQQDGKVTLSALDQILSECEKPHPTNGACCAPGCVKTSSPSWTAFGAGQSYLCWACSALFALQGYDVKHEGLTDAALHQHEQLAHDIVVSTSSLPTSSVTSSASGLLHQPIVTISTDVGEPDFAVAEGEDARRSKCPACLVRDGEFKYFGLSVKLCKACYQLWTHHENYRDQHHESMDEHIKKCIKSTESQRRLQVILSLRLKTGDATAVSMPIAQGDDVFCIVIRGSIIRKPLLHLVQAEVLPKARSVAMNVESITVLPEDRGSVVVFSVAGTPSNVKMAAAYFYDAAASLHLDSWVYSVEPPVLSHLSELYASSGIDKASLRWDVPSSSSNQTVSLSGGVFDTGVLPLLFSKASELGVSFQFDKLLLHPTNIITNVRFCGKSDKVSEVVKYATAVAQGLECLSYSQVGAIRN